MEVDADGGGCGLLCWVGGKGVLWVWGVEAVLCECGICGC